MRLLRALLALVALLAALPARAAALSVVTTVPDLAAIAAEVGRDRVKVTAMALPSQDPHFVDARPNLALELSRADALVLVGLDMEIGWLPVLLTGSRNPRIQVGSAGYIDASGFVPLLDAPTEKLDRAMGDIHPGGNPHYLYDPRNASRVALGLAGRFGILDPANAAVYVANAQDFQRRLDAARLGWEQQAAGLRGLKVVTYHKSFVYLADWLGLSIVSTIEPKPGIPPSPSSLAQLLGLMQSNGVKLILQEAFYPHTTAELVQSKSGARLVRIPGATDVNAGQTYLQHVQGWVDALVGAAG